MLSFFLPRNATSPTSDVAVIQGKNGCHVEIDLTDSVLPDDLQLNSVELTETQVSDECTLEPSFIRD